MIKSHLLYELSYAPGRLRQGDSALNSPAASVSLTLSSKACPRGFIRVWNPVRVKKTGYQEPGKSCGVKLRSSTFHSP